MTLFRFTWLYKLIRKRTKPIPVDTAELWKRRLSVIYMLSAWNALGFLLYFCYGRKPNWNEYYGIKTEEELNQRPAEYYVDLLGLKKAHVVNIKGFTKVDEYDYVNTNKIDEKNDTLKAKRS